MALEKEIIDALTATGLFTKVRYLVAESDRETEPTVLPIAVLSDGGRDFTVFATMCDQSQYVQLFDLTITAETAAQVRDLSDQASTALLGIASVDESTDSYDSELRAYTTSIQLS